MRWYHKIGDRVSLDLNSVFVSSRRKKKGPLYGVVVPWDEARTKRAQMLGDILVDVGDGWIWSHQSVWKPLRAASRPIQG